MTIHEEDGFDTDLAIELSLLCHEICVDCPHDIGLVLAIKIKEMGYEIQGD